MRIEELKALYDKAMGTSRAKWDKDNPNRGHLPLCGLCDLAFTLRGLFPEYCCGSCAFRILSGGNDQTICSPGWMRWANNPTPGTADAVLAEVESITWERFLEYMKTVIEVTE